jgi:hypothetical protein
MEEAMEFRKKPVVIEAFQFQRRNNGPVPYPDWYEDAVTRNDIVTSNTGKWHDPTKPAYCLIQTLEGTMRADEGDWIIRGIKGEIYPCKPDIFAATYEDATPPPASTAGGERQSIDTPEFQALLRAYVRGLRNDDSAALIAHIDTWAARCTDPALHDVEQQASAQFAALAYTAPHVIEALQAGCHVATTLTPAPDRMNTEAVYALKQEGVAHD